MLTILARFYIQQVKLVKKNAYKIVHNRYGIFVSRYKVWCYVKTKTVWISTFLWLSSQMWDTSPMILILTFNSSIFFIIFISTITMYMYWYPKLCSGGSSAASSVYSTKTRTKRRGVIYTNPSPRYLNWPSKCTK